MDLGDLVGRKIPPPFPVHLAYYPSYQLGQDTALSRWERLLLQAGASEWTASLVKHPILCNAYWPLFLAPFAGPSMCHWTLIMGCWRTQSLDFSSPLPIFTPLSLYTEDSKMYSSFQGSPLKSKLICPTTCLTSPFECVIDI